MSSRRGTARATRRSRSQLEALVSEREHLCQDLTQLRQEWERMKSLTRIYRYALQILDFADAAANTDGTRATASGSSGSGWSMKLSAPYEEGMLIKLFSAPPTFRHMLGELLGSLETVDYFDSNLLIQDSGITHLWLLESFASTFDALYKPIVAVQTQCLVNPRGLLECVPRLLSPDLFPDCGLSSQAVFAENKSVSICGEATFVPPHISFCSVGELHTTVNGWKLFVSWAATEKNRTIMQTWHLRHLEWDEALDLMRELEEPLINYLSPGQTIYIAAGRVSMTLAADIGGVYTIRVANPAVTEWQHIVCAHSSAVEGYLYVLSTEGSDTLAEAMRRMEFERDLWREALPGLPDSRRDGTVTRTEVKSFLEQMSHDIALLRGIVEARQTDDAVFTISASSVEDARSSGAGGRISETSAATAPPPELPPQGQQQGLDVVVITSRAAAKRKIELLLDDDEDKDAER
ncbi:uncharacterized protein UTRI_10075 [Ustilago trichophora]|uniref:Uncharacterized protein n=1 Tax=Ustilago trichophora TaxID=86804 RepID=A0A5C3E4Y4_9BASI|nr:uncharacterized protein UTRI_10075 [Ustilago trichophora]